MAKEVITFRLDPAERVEIRRIVEAERADGRELSESVFIRTALRQHIRRENGRLGLASPETREESET